MRNRFASFIFAISVTAWILSTLTFAQGAPGGQRQGRNAAPQGPSVPHDSHDLSGVWQLSARQTAGFTLSNDVPPRSAYGETKFNANKPSYGPRAIPPAQGNDPTGMCDPLGVPRILFFTNWPVEIFQAPGRMVQVFEWNRVYREIWTDGRSLPKDPDDLKWLGYSIGRWDGDTFVVDSNGFDDRSWLDHFGNPHSSDMHLQERYHRVDQDTLELTMTVTDPKVYTKPWISEKKTFRLVPKGEVKEMFCVPSEEQSFNARIRNPAGGVTKK